jgi:hypothetical protein
MASLLGMDISFIPGMFEMYMKKTRISGIYIYALMIIGVFNIELVNLKIK